MPVDEKLACEEAFAPVVCLFTYERFDDALAMVNRSRFGLQAGVFTDSASLIERAFQSLEVGERCHRGRSHVPGGQHALRGH